MTEGIYKTSDPAHQARQVVCPKCCAAITAACTEQGRPFGRKFVDYYHQERVALVEGKS